MAGRKFWAGFTDDKLAIREIDTGFGGFGSGDGKHRAPMLFPSRAAARKEYQDVRPVEVRVIQPTKFK